MARGARSKERSDARRAHIAKQGRISQRQRVTVSGGDKWILEVYFMELAVSNFFASILAWLFLVLGPMFFVYIHWIGDCFIGRPWSLRHYVFNYFLIALTMNCVFLVQFPELRYLVFHLFTHAMDFLQFCKQDGLSALKLSCKVLWNLLKLQSRIIEFLLPSVPHFYNGIRHIWM